MPKNDEKILNKTKEEYYNALADLLQRRLDSVEKHINKIDVDYSKNISSKESRDIINHKYSTKRSAILGDLKTLKSNYDADKKTLSNAITKARNLAKKYNSLANPTIQD